MIEGLILFGLLTAAFFVPVYLMWKRLDWHTAIKLVLTAALLFVWVTIIFGRPNND